jgi:hypothetical protein
VELPAEGWDGEMDVDGYDDLAFYTLAHPDPAFIHQLVVDAYAAQAAGPDTKPVRLTFALVGLYLVVEKGFTGRQVQQVHRALAGKRKTWPTFPLPDQRGEITVRQVLAAAPGEARDAMIYRWCASVWEAYGERQEAIRELVRVVIGVA